MNASPGKQEVYKKIEEVASAIVEGMRCLNKPKNNSTTPNANTTTKPKPPTDIKVTKILIPQIMAYYDNSPFIVGSKYDGTKQDSGEYNMEVAKRITLPDPIITPDTATNKGFTWSSSNTTVAKIVDFDVAGNGVLKLTILASSPGDTIITVTANDGSNVKDSFKLKVRGQAPGGGGRRNTVYRKRLFRRRRRTYRR